MSVVVCVVAGNQPCRLFYFSFVASIGRIPYSLFVYGLDGIFVNNFPLNVVFSCVYLWDC